MTLKVLDIRRHKKQCYRGFVSASSGYLYSSRSGQLWKCKIPGYNNNSLVVFAEVGHKDYRNCLGKIIWMKYDSRGKKFWTRDPSGSLITYDDPGFDREGYAFAIKHNKQYVLWRGNEYRVVWTRASWYEIVLNDIGQ